MNPPILRRGSSSSRRSSGVRCRTSWRARTGFPPFVLVNQSGDVLLSSCHNDPALETAYGEQHDPLADRFGRQLAEPARAAIHRDARGTVPGDGGAAADAA